MARERRGNGKGTARVGVTYLILASLSRGLQHSRSQAEAALPLRVPPSLQASWLTRLFPRGGKMDDITVVVAIVGGN